MQSRPSGPAAVATSVSAHAMQLRAALTAQVGKRAQRNGPFELTVTVRWLPLMSAAYGTRVAATAQPLGEGRSLAAIASWQEPGRLAAAGWRLKLHPSLHTTA